MRMNKKAVNLLINEDLRERARNYGINLSAFLEINYVKTPLIHFPLLILIIGGISAILIGLGLIIYRKREI